MRTFVFSDGKSNKFWTIDLQGSGFTVTFGKVGSKGQTQKKDFPDSASAKHAHAKLVAEKLGKGYVETTAGRQPVQRTLEEALLAPLQRSLEQALVENPDDLAAHSAYADYLAEQGDPRGELIQAQLALEDPGRPAEERKQFQQREADLLKRHARQWLGDLGPLLVGDWSGPDKPYQYHLARGWLDLVRVLPYPDGIVAAVVRSPQLRLLRRLEVVYDMRYHPFDFDQFMQGPAQALGDEDEEMDTYEAAEVMPPLLHSPYLSNLRVLKVGFSDTEGRPRHSTMVGPFGGCTAQQVIDLLAKCPRLEELYLNTDLPGIERLFASPRLGNLRVLQYYYGTPYGRRPWRDDPGAAYPLTDLADNAALKRLTTLRLHPGRDGQVGLEAFAAVLRSPHLPGLTHLQVHMTAFGDEGCRPIIESGALRRLKILDIGYGNLSDEGARRLAACPDLKRLEVIDVSRNALTAQGVAALRAAGIQVVADDQHDPDEQGYFYEVDAE